MSKPPRPILSVAVKRPTPFTFDLGLLLANDPNPLLLSPAAATDAETVEASLGLAARDGAQALISQLLTTCAATSMPDGVRLALPPPVTALPREKPVPQARPLTRWKAFAGRRGIQPKTRDARKNMQFDVARQEWRAKWGRFGINKDTERDWLIETDPRAEQMAAKGEATVRSQPRRDRLDAVRRNTKRQLRNLREVGHQPG